MTQKLNYTVFETPTGWMGILGSEKGLLRTTLPRRSTRDVERILDKNLINGATCSSQPFTELVERFQLYFRGQKVTFPDPLDLSIATSFQRRVWAAARLIPYGETRSYAWIAKQIKSPAAARAVGQALGANPLPIIIPCHRVLSSNGGLGGFGGGLKLKRRLLKLEGNQNIP